MKRRVIEFLEQGIFQRNITKMIGYNQTAINYLKKKYNERGNISNRKKCDRSCVTIKQNDGKLRAIDKNRQDVLRQKKLMSSRQKTWFAIVPLKIE